MISRHLKSDWPVLRNQKIFSIGVEWRLSICLITTHRMIQTVWLADIWKSDWQSSGPQNFFNRCGYAYRFVCLTAHWMVSNCMINRHLKNQNGLILEKYKKKFNRCGYVMLISPLNCALNYSNCMISRHLKIRMTILSKHKFFSIGVAMFRWFVDLTPHRIHSHWMMATDRKFVWIKIVWSTFAPS